MVLAGPVQDGSPRSVPPADGRSHLSKSPARFPVGARRTRRCPQAVRRWSYASARWCRSCRRELMPSLENTLCRWYSAVRGLMNSWAPISGFVWPSAASRATCAEPGQQPGVGGGDHAFCGQVLPQPGHLGRGEVRVERQPGDGGQAAGRAGKALADVRGPPILPDDGRVSARPDRRSQASTVSPWLASAIACTGARAAALARCARCC